MKMREGLVGSSPASPGRNGFGNWVPGAARGYTLTPG